MAERVIVGKGDNANRYHRRVHGVLLRSGYDVTTRAEAELVGYSPCLKGCYDENGNPVALVNVPELQEGDDMEHGPLFYEAEAENYTHRGIDGDAPDMDDAAATAELLTYLKSGHLQVDTGVA